MLAGVNASNPLAAAAQDEKFLANVNNLEIARVKDIANNIKTAIQALLPTGGFMFVTNLGASHAHRVAYFLDEVLTPLVHQDAVSIHTLRFLPAQSCLTAKERSELIPKFKNKKWTKKGIDTAIMEQFYETHPALDLETSKNGNGYQCSEFDKFIKLLAFDQALPAAIPSTLLSLHSKVAPMMLFNSKRKDEPSYWQVADDKLFKMPDSARLEVIAEEDEKDAIDKVSGMYRGVLA